ncbi:MAG: hypothetical protein Rubg2KO_00590 [Rubricoccaceae bacterium]
MLYRLGLTLLIVVGAGCSFASVDEDACLFPDNAFSATIGGAPLLIECVYVARAVDQQGETVLGVQTRIDLSRRDSTGVQEAMNLSIVGAAPDETYAFSGDPEIDFGETPPTDVAFLAYSPLNGSVEFAQSGTVTLTTFTESGASGTFTATINGQAVTNGSFTVTY